jgi:hypothetical protein
MHQIRESLRRPLALALTAGAVSALALSACGGSSGTASTGSGTDAAATSAANGATGAGGKTTGSAEQPRSASGATGPAGARPRLGAVRACLQRNGVKLPTPRGGFFLGGAALPKGVNRTQLQAAMRKCLGGRGFFAGGGPGAFRRRTASPRFQQALSAFAACLRQNGIAVPNPNTSGSGPVFSTKGIDTASPKFRAATAKCRSALIGAFGLHRTGPRAGGAAGAQPTG